MHSVVAVAAVLAAAALVSAEPRHLMTCSQPQPRAVSARQLVRFADGVVQPPYAVLHRCDDGAGACLGGLSCVPTALEEVQLVFRVTPLTPGATDESFQLVTAANHTSCGCEALAN